MFKILQVVPIIVPQDTAIRAEVAQDIETIGAWLLLGALLALAFSGFTKVAELVVKLIRYLKRKKRQGG